MPHGDMWENMKKARVAEAARGLYSKKLPRLGRGIGDIVCLNWAHDGL